MGLEPIHSEKDRALRVCLHAPILSASPSGFIIVLMVTACLMGRMGSTPILPIRRAVTIGTIVKPDWDGDGGRSL